jgi:hypothetical protein
LGQNALKSLEKMAEKMPEAQAGLPAELAADDIARLLNIGARRLQMLAADGIVRKARHGRLSARRNDPRLLRLSAGARQHLDARQQARK